MNAGTGTAAKLAQIVVGTTPDGKMGPKTLAALNNYDADLFLARYALAKGLSPLARGNLTKLRAGDLLLGPIPARAGQPALQNRP